MLVKRSGPVGCCRRGRILCRHYCCAHQNCACNCHAQGGQCSGSSHHFLPRAKSRIAKTSTMLYKPSQVKVANFVSDLALFCKFCCKRSARRRLGRFDECGLRFMNARGELPRHQRETAPQRKAHVNEACGRLNLQTSYAMRELVIEHLPLVVPAIRSASSVTWRRVPNRSGECPQPSSVGATDHDLFSAGTGTPAIFTLKEPRLVRVQK